jgi:zinc D-Ala-D-Ala dipeptidase
MERYLFYLCIFICLNTVFTNGQAASSNKPQPKSCQYETVMAKLGLVNVQEMNSNIMVELKYSTTDNFTAKDVYGCLSACYLQKKAANMLNEVSKYLQTENKNLRLLVYDGARPAQIQKILWESLPQYSPKKRETFVASPSKGSIHNYGSAVDITLANQNGTPLDMGTKYDFFGELAYPKFEDKFLAQGKLTKTQVANRKLLRKVMQKAGFMPIKYEWWHFNAVSRAQAKAIYKIIP